jgi:hypothetical protein
MFTQPRASGSNALSSTWLVLGSVLAACAADASGVGADEQALRRQGSSIPFQEFIDPGGVGSAGLTPAHVLITRPAQYQRLLGHAPPAALDLRREAVVFYSAGEQPTGGFNVSVLDVRAFGSLLRISTQLESTLEGCFVTPAPSHPTVLARLSLPKRLFITLFDQQDSVRDCSPQSDCDGSLCLSDYHCEPVPDEGCATPLCAPVRRCEPNVTRYACGGIAAIACPGAGQCMDDPDDDCDPADGGADCPGLCHCVQQGPCGGILTFDRSPNVCMCVRAPEPG